MEVFLVGGAVRDELLGRAVRERDWVVVGATPEQMLARGFKRKDPTFPVFIDPASGDEYALARTERKRGDGHRGFEVDYRPGVTLEEDLARRDLTINAMARAASGELIDPFNGREDIAQRWLRRVTPAFVEDPLRALRLARFAAELGGLGFRIEARTEGLARRVCQGPDFASLSGERIWRETERALGSERPASYFEALVRWRAASRILPELTDAHGRIAPAILKKLAALDGTKEAVASRLAALFASAHCADDDGARTSERVATALAQRLGLPRATRELLTVICRPLPSQPLEADRVLEWIESMDALRRPQRLSTALEVRVLLGGLSSTCRTRLLQLVDRVRTARPRPGPTISRESMRELRIAVLQACLRGDAQ